MAHERVSNEPHDPLTRLANVGLEAIEAVPGTEDMRAIVLVISGKDGGMAIAGYGDDVDDVPSSIVADLLVHARAILRTQGKDLVVVPL